MQSEVAFSRDDAADPRGGGYGAKDRTRASTPATRTKNLAELGVTHDVAVYPEAGHSFYTEATGRIPPMIGPGSCAYWLRSS